LPDGKRCVEEIATVSWNSNESAIEIEKVGL
jgi:hypothetical protein